MSLSIFALLLAFAQVQAFDCTKQFWPSIKKSGSRNTVSGTCQWFPGYPRTTNGIKVSVAYTTDWDTANKAIINQLTPVLKDGLDNSINFYKNKLSDAVPEVVVIITDLTHVTDKADTWFPFEKKPPCQIRLYKPWTDWVGPHAAYAKQALAHEMYHCVQQFVRGYDATTKVSSVLWIVEGSANYFSNLVFPSANVEWPAAIPNRAYQPSLPIYAQPGGHVYGASMFFQSLEASKGRADLNNWVLSADFEQDALAERKTLSTLTGFTDDFWTFAQQFALGNIVDTSGVPIQGLAKVGVTNVAPATGALTLTAKTFTIKTFRLSLSPGQIVMLLTSPNDHQRIAYRLLSDNAWSQLPDTLELDCDNSGTKTNILLLFVSTKIAATDTLHVSVKQTKKDCGCKNSKRQDGSSCPIGDGKGFVLYPLEDAQGSAYCPTGTHASTLAAWCCPNGSNLDEKHASEVSLCCPGQTDCYNAIVPNNLKCADPDWILWSKDFQQIGCCMKGYYPTSLRYCVKDSGQLGPGYTAIPTGSVSTSAAAIV